MVNPLSSPVFPPLRVAWILILTAAVALAVPGENLQAQGTLRGQVVDSETGDPVPGASVRIRRLDPVRADSTGRFEAANLAAGNADVTIEALGYSRNVWRVFIADQVVSEQLFPLDFTGERLPDIVVQARAELLMPRYMDFERRRGRALGAFFRWDELSRGGYSSVGDALRTVRGVRIQCNQQTFECHAMMARATVCRPVWWVDGVEVRSFHENTPIRDVYGIEIYRGAGEVPGEFAGSAAGCGVIVVWTKSRPFR
jgi:hypothetical protein